MRNSIFILSLGLLFFYSCSQPTNEEGKVEEPASDAEVVEAEPLPVLEKIWETDTLLKVAESVLYDTEGGFAYVSCINGQPLDKDGSGYIAKIDLEGNIIEEKWATSLNAPKGMGLSGGLLFVTDIDRVVAFNTTSGELDAVYQVKDASFLNDIAVDENGDIYFSDSNTNRIHLISNDGELSTWLESDAYKGPNGLWIQEGFIYMAGYGDGNMYRINMQNKSVEKITEGIGGGDGIEEIDRNSFVVSDWNGQVFHIDAEGNKLNLLDTRDAGSNAADIDYLPEQKILLVPTFFNNTVAAYKLTSN